MIIKLADAQRPLSDDRLDHAGRTPRLRAGAGSMIKASGRGDGHGNHRPEWR